MSRCKLGIHGPDPVRPARRPASGCVLALAIGLGLAGAAETVARDLTRDQPSAVLVKYRSEGPAALDACAEALSVTGRPFADATRDRSDSLDRLHRRLGLGPHRAWLGARAGESLAARRRRLEARQARLARQGEARTRAGAAASAPAEASFADLAHVYRIEIPEGRSATAIAAQLSADPHVEYAQPDHLMTLDQAPPFDDPFLTSAGAWGQPYEDLWGLLRIRAPEAWSTSTGAGVVVAVVDSGIDPAHPDMAANLWVNPGEDLDGDGRAGPGDVNGIDDDGNGFVDDLIGFDFINSLDTDGDGLYDGPQDVSDADPFDDNGHGTHVAGTIAAVAGNGLGIAGVAPGARVMALKGFPAAGSAPDSVLWRAVLYAAENGARVVNNSWSCGTPCPENPLAQEVLGLLAASDVVVVTSAGNASQDVLFWNPENDPRVINVGAIGFDDALSDFSNRGWLMDVVAPGGGPSTPLSVRLARRNILSLLSSGASEEQRSFAVADAYLRLSGTSMSAPHVAGAVALLLAQRPRLTPEQVRRLVRLSARDLGRAGRDPVFGSGALDARALLDAAVPDLRLIIGSPRPGTLHDPADGDVVLRGEASGADLVAVEIEVGRGLTPGVFEPIGDFGESRIGGSAGARHASGPGDAGVLARWDVREVPDGPYVLRVRASLVDGRVAEELTIVGIERSHPFPISAGDEPAAQRPAIESGRVAWHANGAEDAPGDADLFVARFAAWAPPGVGAIAADDGRFVGNGRGPRPLLERPGDQRDVRLAGRSVFWRERTASGERLQHCLSGPGRRPCEPQTIESAIAGAFVGGGWILWTRFEGLTRTIVGCRFDARSGRCDAAPVVDASVPGSWLLHSFDGRTMLIGDRGRLALCPLAPGARTCTPEPIALTTFEVPFEPVHDGGLVVYALSRFELRPPPGCDPEVVEPGCAPTAELAVQYHACELEEPGHRCDAIPIAEPIAVADALGLEVSGRRILWSAGDPTALPSIRFCEYDALARQCVEQRLGGAPSVAGHPALEGDRVVWEDARLGPIAIFGYALPSLGLPRVGSLRAGRSFAIPFVARPGSAGSIEVALEPIDGPAPRDLRILGGRRGASGGGMSGGRGAGAGPSAAPVGQDAGGGPTLRLLVGRLPAEATGTARWRLRGTTNTGLVTEEVLVLEITAPASSLPGSR